MLRDLPEAVIISLIVIVAAAVTGGVGFPILLMLEDDIETQITDVDDQISAVQQDIRIAEVDMGLILENRDYYCNILERGVLQEVGRLEAVAVMQRLRQEYRMGELEFTFQPTETVEPSAGRLRRDYTFLSSRVSLRSGGFVDRDVLAFLHSLGLEFPGAAMLQSVELSRETGPTPGILDRIVAGEFPALVALDLSFDWRQVEINDAEAAVRELETQSEVLAACRAGVATEPPPRDPQADAR